MAGPKPPPQPHPMPSIRASQKHDTSTTISFGLGDRAEGHLPDRRLRASLPHAGTLAFAGAASVMIATPASAISPPRIISGVIGVAK